MSINATGCGFDPHLRNLIINIFISSLWHQGKSSKLGLVTQHVIPKKIGGRQGAEFLNTRFPLLALLYAGDSVNLIYFYFFKYIKTNSQTLKINICTYIYFPLRNFKNGRTVTSIAYLSHKHYNKTPTTRVIYIAQYKAKFIVSAST